MQSFVVTITQGGKTQTFPKKAKHGIAALIAVTKQHINPALPSRVKVSAA